MRQPLLNTTQLHRSLHVLGDARSPVWNRLDAGLPVTIGVLGASVAMNGGCQLEHQPELRCADFDGSSRRRKWAYGRDDSTGRAVRGFALQSLDWVNATWPHAGHRVHNVAVDVEKLDRRGDGVHAPRDTTGRFEERVEHLVERLHRLRH